MELWAYHRSPQMPCKFVCQGGRGQGSSPHFPLEGMSGRGLKPPEKSPPLTALGSQAEGPGAQPHLAHRHTEHARVQQARGWVGAHLTHEGEPLPPAHAVLLHLLPADQARGECETAGHRVQAGPAASGGRECTSHFLSRVMVFSQERACVIVEHRNR